MEKYGVKEISAIDKKQANTQDSHCPWCKKPLKVHGDVYLCPEHGSKPFE